MIRFLDGPAAGAVLSLRRVPHFLRVVIDRAGKVDALDQLDDVIRDGETAYVYENTGEVAGFVCSRGKNRGCSRLAHYRFYAIQPGQDVLRNNEAWGKWAMAEAEARFGHADRS